MNFGEKLKQLRKVKNETQAELANFLNITYQSVSKWENNDSLPDIEMLVKIKEHYNVSIDSLLDIDTKDMFHFKIDINEESKFCVFTDKVTAIYAPSRYRTMAKAPYQASNNKYDYIIGVNKEGKIIYFAPRTGYDSGTPSGNFYFSGTDNSAELDCFYLLEDYKPYQDVTSRKTLDYLMYEFIVPKDGMVIVGNEKVYNFCLLLHTIKKRSINKKRNIFDVSSYKIGELDQFRLKLVGNELVLICPKKEEFIMTNNEQISQYIKLLEEKLEELIEKVEEYEERFDDLENQINDLDSRLDDIEWETS